MTPKELRRAQHLVGEMEKIGRLIRELSNVVLDPTISIPPEVLQYVAQAPAANGLRSLLVERSASVQAELEELGVEYEEPTQPSCVQLSGARIAL